VTQKSASPVLRAAVIGLGRVGAGFSCSSNTLAAAQNHADTYRLHPRTQLLAGSDPDATQRALCQERFACPVFADPQEMLAVLQPEVVSICSPTHLHAEHLQMVLNAGVTRIWLEKPPAQTWHELQVLQQKVQQSQARVVVHYLRRYTPLLHFCRQAIREKKLGDLVALQMHYSRGLLTNGSHFLDLAFFLLDDPGRFQVVAVDATQREEPSALLRIGRDEGVAVTLTGMNLDYHNLDLSMTFTRGRITLLHGGMERRWEERVAHPVFAGAFILQEKADRLPPGGFDGCFAAALDDLLRDGAEPVSGLAQAAQTQALLHALLGS
jgi:predicted dehydrogenase